MLYSKYKHDQNISNVRNRKRLTLKKNKIKTHVSMFLNYFERFYVIAVSDMYHPITIHHTNFLPIEQFHTSNCHRLTQLHWFYSLFHPYLPFFTRVCQHKMFINIVRSVVARGYHSHIRK